MDEICQLLITKLLPLMMEQEPLYTSDDDDDEDTG